MFLSIKTGINRSPSIPEGLFTPSDMNVSEPLVLQAPSGHPFLIAIIVLYSLVSLLLSACGIGVYRHVRQRRQPAVVGRRSPDSFPSPIQFLSLRNHEQWQDDVDPKTHSL